MRTRLARRPDLAVPPALDERARQLGVELGAGAALQLDERLLDGERRPVRARRGHGVEGVGDAEQPRLERDPVPAQPVRVAAAVPALVVVEHVRQRRLEVLEALDEPRARDRVAANLLELLLAQRAGLAEHARVDGDLADVVERAAELERLQAAATPAEQPSERLGERRHPSRVAAQVRVSSLERRGEGGEQRAHNARVSRAGSGSLPRRPRRSVEFALREGRSPERDRRQRAPGGARPRLRRAPRGRRLRGRSRAGRRRRGRLPRRGVRRSRRGRRPARRAAQRARRQSRVSARRAPPRWPSSLRAPCSSASSRL